MPEEDGSSFEEALEGLQEQEESDRGHGTNAHRKLRREVVEVLPERDTANAETEAPEQNEEVTCMESEAFREPA